MLAELRSEADIAEWRELGATYPILYDEDDYYTYDVYEITVRPTFLLIDRDMTVLDRDEGPLGLEHVEMQAREMLRD